MKYFLSEASAPLLFRICYSFIIIEPFNAVDFGYRHGVIQFIYLGRSPFRLFVISFDWSWLLCFLFIISCLSTLPSSRSPPLSSCLPQSPPAIFFLVYIYVLPTVESTVVSPFLPSLCECVSLCNLLIVVFVLLYISKDFLLPVLLLLACLFLLFFLPLPLRCVPIL